ncbi:MAG: type I DNA topoisomerase [Patescibacteria group bacterium]
MKKNLVIVESPTKAKTISRFLGKKFVVQSSYGHIRDLPKRLLGVDVLNNFEPHYVIPPKNKKAVAALKKAAKNAEIVYFATDADREGEAIAWHLSEILKTPPERARRIVFHEITKEAVEHALANPRAIDRGLVDAQQARRILDRLVGYKLSPFLWKKIVRGLSAGRVQSVAVRLTVSREREIIAFTAQEYWTIEGTFATPADEQFAARLHRIGEGTLQKFDIPTEAQAKKITGALAEAQFAVAAVEQKEVRRTPSAPFTTSTLQQEANRKFGFTAKQTMMLAQRLYEGQEIGDEGSVGLITYMRTDSVSLSEKFTDEVRNYLHKTFGESYGLAAARRFTTKSKLAQEAHEAIRPTSAWRTPEQTQKYLEPSEQKLYEIIWRRAVASQMPEAMLEASAVDLETTADDASYGFRATGSVIRFDGFLRVGMESLKETVLPELREGMIVRTVDVAPNQHFTEPPARYSDASLVHALEEHDIGRPSTYAPTIATIIDRGYVLRVENRRLKPTEIAFQVTDLLVEHFPQIVDYGFTAKMEGDLDRIATGETSLVPILREFYEPFAKLLKEKEKIISKKELTEEATDEICARCGKPMIIKLGRYGKFYACSAFPTCRYTRPLEETELPETHERCEKCGEETEIKKGPFGLYFRCTKCAATKAYLKSTGVPCPSCGKGAIVERRTRRGKIFFSCDQYPTCTFALWNRPTGEKCPQCGSLVVEMKNKKRCSKKECSHEELKA